MNTEKKGFLSLKDWTRKDYGRNAVVGLLGGFVLTMSGYAIGEVLGGIISLLSLVCGLVWLVKIIRRSA